MSFGLGLNLGLGKLRKASPPPAGYDVFIVIGQSNSYYGVGLDPLIDTVDAKMFQLSRGLAVVDRYVPGLNFDIIPALDPMQHRDIQEGSIGHATKFGKTYVSNDLASTRELLLLPCALGGSSFIGGRWNKTNDLYEDAVARANFVTTTYPNTVIKGFIWHQGEADVALGSAAYKDNLTAMINNIRTDVTGATANTPFIIGGMVPEWIDATTNANIVEAAHKAIPSEISYTAYYDGRLPTTLAGTAGDVLHYSAASHRLLADRAYSAYLAAKQNVLAPTEPDAITDLNASADNLQVNLSWSEPADNRSTITHYIIDYKLASEPTVWTNFSSNEPTVNATVTGLTNDLLYDFRVYAVNAVGTSLVSNIDQSTPTSVTIPTAVETWSFTTNLNADSGGITTVVAGDYAIVSDATRGNVMQNTVAGSLTSSQVQSATNSYAFTVYANLANHLGNNILFGIDGGQNLVFWTDSGNLNAGHADNISRLSVPNLLATDRWDFFGLTYDVTTTTLNMYHNNVLVATDSATPVAPNAGDFIRIGSWNVSTAQWFNGKMSDARTFDRLLTDAEMEQVRLDGLI